MVDITFEINGNGNLRGTFNGLSVNMASVFGSFFPAGHASRVFKNVPLGDVEVDLLLTATSGASNKFTILNNGNIIHEAIASRLESPRLDTLLIEDLPAVTPPDLTPDLPAEDCFIFANIFRMQGSTAQGAPPQEKVLVSSGKISCESVEALKATGHIIEEIEEGEVAPPEVAPVTPQAPFVKVGGVKVTTENLQNQNGGRIFSIRIKENLGFREV